MREIKFMGRCDNCGAMVRSRFQGQDSDLLRTLAR